MKAAFSNQQGDFLKISCDKVYNLSFQTSYFATNQEIAILNAELVNLKIREFIQGDENKKGQKQFFFWLTQSRQLSPCHST